MYQLNLKDKRNVIFDFDGLLVNSEEVINDAWIQTCNYFGIIYPEGFFDDIVGVSKWVTFDKLKVFMGVDIDSETFFRRRAIFIDKAVGEGKLVLMPGVKKILAELYDRKIPLYIATSSSRSWPKKVLDKLEVSHYFVKMYGEEDVEFVKPNPDLYLKVLDENNLSADDTIVFEDSFSGVSAAVAAKLDVVVVNKIQFDFPMSYKEHILNHILSFEDVETDL